MDEFCLLDIWRARHPDESQYSWFKRGEITKASRIDFILISGGLDQKVEMVQYLSSIMTDHRAIYMVISIHQGERGPGYWKLNTSLLSNSDYVSMMNKEIKFTLSSSSSMDPISKWEKLKERVKKATCRFARSLASENQLVISNLAEKVNNYEERLPLEEDEDKMYYETKADLEEKLLEKAKGAMFRSKVRWQELGEKNTKYFFSLEKARYNAKTCYKLVTDNGQEITDGNKILEEQRKFYLDLYSVEENVKFNLTNTSSVKVPEDIKSEQELQITIEDLQKAIKSMNNNKTPGYDGLPVDFYKVFWNGLSQCFYDMVLESYERNILHESARQGILNLIPKAQKDVRQIKNLRPITLLNSDYKIIEKAIANKMIPALESIIHKDQRGFMKKRRISVNIRKMLDIMHIVEKDDLEAVVLSLDFVKCFDKCSFSILHGSLDFFEFGSIVKQWTKILYKDFFVKIQNNGHFSSEIPINKGVHQGGCCSSIYFLVIAEILAMALRDNSEIEGITYQDIRNILNQFADDMDIFSLCKERQIRAIFNKLESFRLQSGFTVSYEKTTLYRIGSLRHSDAQLYNMSEYAWSNKDIKVLGVTIAHENIVEKNYNSLIEKSRSTLDAWFNRGLTLMGKVQVVNALVASLFVYKMMVLPSVPKNIIKTLENIIREFIWDKKKSKVALPILQLPKKQGGLNLVNLRVKEKALKATWPQILSTEEDYSKMVYGIMRCSLIGENIWRCTIAPEDVKLLKMKNTFWKDILTCWSEYNFMSDFCIENQIIWYNSYIKVGGNLIMWNDVYQKGLMYVFQLFEGGQFKSEEMVFREFGLTRLRFNSLKSAIPKEWKTFLSSVLRQEFFPLRPYSYDISLRNIKLSQFIYQYLSEDATIMINKYVKWNEELGCEISDGIYDFALKYRNLYRITNITEYRSFQYRFLQRAIVLNTHLYKWGLKSIDTCSFCDEHKESITHVFYQCEVIQLLWEEVDTYIQNHLGVVPCITMKNVILDEIANVKIANFICMVTKRFIYVERCMGRQPLFRNLEYKIKNLRNVERYIAVKNSKLACHEKKWKMYDQNDSDFIVQYIAEM